MLVKMISNFTYDYTDNIITARGLDYVTSDQYGMGHAFFYAMKKYENEVAQIDGKTGHKQTYATLMKRCINTALEMKSRGINTGDIISICSYNQLDSGVPFYAAQFLGVKVASLDPTISLDDTILLLKQVRPKMIFISDDAITLIETAAKKAGLMYLQIIVFGHNANRMSFEKFISPKDDENLFEPVKVYDRKTAVIFFSSGTTGMPKGIELSHYSLLMQGMSMMEYGFDNSVALGYASLYWISSVVFTIASIMKGRCRVIAKSFTTQEYWAMLDDLKVTLSFMAPSQAIHVLKAGRPENVDTTSLLDVIMGGGPISTENLESIRDIFPGTNVHLAYGQTEVGGASTVFKPASREDLLLMLLKGNSSGRPMPGFSYKVVDPETKQILGPYQNGELRVKTNFCMNGYHNLDSTNAWDDAGWLKTGDVVYYDEDFCFYIVDRIKEMLKFQSWHVPPAKIEGVLLTHPGVSQVIVIGIPDEDDGDHPMAVVVRSTDSDVTEEELVKFVEERVDDKQRLRAGVLFLDELPYTPSGKVKRKEVRDMILLSMKK